MCVWICTFSISCGCQPTDQSDWLKPIVAKDGGQHWSIAYMSHTMTCVFSTSSNSPYAGISFLRRTLTSSSHLSHDLSISLWTIIYISAQTHLYIHTYTYIYVLFSLLALYYICVCSSSAKRWFYSGGLLMTAHQHLYASRIPSQEVSQFTHKPYSVTYMHMHAHHSMLMHS